MGCCKSSSQREIHSNTGLPQINNLTHHLYELEKEEQNLKSAEGRKIIKIREEISKTEIQKPIEKKSRKLRTGSLKG